VPEGDTVHHAANRIRPVLEGHVPDELATPHPRFARDRWPERLAGQAVTSVDAHGKHLFVRFEGGLVIHSHLRMSGKWRVRDAAEPRPPRTWLILRRGDRQVQQINGPVLELMTAARARTDQRIAGLGPDILGPMLDEAAVVRRLRADDPTRPIGDALIDQRTIAGIGNLWKARAASRPRSTRGGAPATSPTRRRWRSSAQPRRDAAVGRDGMQDRFQVVYGTAGQPCPRCGDARSGARPGRRQPDDILVSRVPALRRIGHKGADLIVPGNTPASFDAALAHGVDMIEFDVLPEHARPRPAAARPRLRRTSRRADARGGPRAPRRSAVRRRRARRRPQAPGYEERVVAALREHGLVERTLSRPTGCARCALRELEPRLRLGWSVPRVKRDYTQPG
jgi:endonuclease-8